MKRLITVLASIAMLGTLFVGAPKPVFASVSEIYYIGAGGGSSTGCGVPDIMISPDNTVAGDEDFRYDNFDGALAYALTFVDDGDVIQLCDTYETQDVTTGYWYVDNDMSLWNGDQNANPSIVDPIDVTIRGLGPEETVLNAQGAYHLFNFVNVNLTLEDMFLYNGDAEGASDENGGAVRLDGGSLTIDNVVLRGFSAGDSGDGMFVWVNNADLTVTGASFDHDFDFYQWAYNEGSGGAIYSTTTSANTTISIDNTEFIGLGAWDVGGAIYAYCADMTISDSEFEDNTAGISGGAIFAYGDDANCESTGSLTINEGTQFDRNHIHEDFGGEGGVGGAVYSEGQPVTIADSNFGRVSNVYGVYDGNWNNDGNGGALYVDGTSGTALTITDSKFFDNSSGWNAGGAVYASCANVNIDGNGEGITSFDQASLENAANGTNSTKFIGNSAYQDGGAIYLDAEDCNDDSGDGSGVNEYVDASIDGVRFSDNSSGGQGGVIATNQSGFNWLEGLTVSSSFFVANRSYNSDGGVINSDHVDVAISGSLFAYNRAEDGGVAELCSANIEIANSAFLENLAWAGNGGVIYTGNECGRNADDITIDASIFAGNTSDDNGGVLWAENDSLITIDDSEFYDNTSGYGGGVGWIESADVEISDSFFGGNLAYEEGGAFDFEDGNYMRINRSTFVDNSSGAFGGGYAPVSNDGGAIDFGANGAGVYLGVFDSVFEGNYATSDGGAIWWNADNTTGTMSIQRSTFRNNTSEAEGGAMYVELDDEGSLLIDRTAFTGNTAWQDGGAINQDTDDEFTFVRITNSSFTDNSAGSDGGALDLTDRAVLTNNTFVGNNATLGAGGAVELNEENEDDSLAYLFTVTGNTFRLNTAGVAYDTGDGGALNVYGPALITSNTFTSNAAYGSDGEGGAIDFTNDANSNVTTISKNVFTGNYSGDDGGAIYAGNDPIVIASNTFTSNTSNDDGGAVYLDDDNSVITKNTFNRNYAFDNGGALYADDLSFPRSSITDNLFDSNGAADNGGAMWIDDDEGAMDHKVVIASNRVIRNTAENGAGIYVTYPFNAASPSQLMSGIIRNTFERNIASFNGGGVMMEYRGGAYSNARAALQALKKAVKNNRYKANKANLDRATGDIGGVAITMEVGSAEVEVPEVRLPEAPKAK
jgi:predicted outer membrane repeat protein